MSAQSDYKAAAAALEKFCNEETNFAVEILTENYPLSVKFTPNAQMSLFDSENYTVDENGEIGNILISVGQSTRVLSTLRFKMDAKLMKKMIKLSEKVGNAYLHAFREGAQFAPAAIEKATDLFVDELWKTCIPDTSVVIFNSRKYKQALNTVLKSVLSGDEVKIPEDLPEPPPLKYRADISLYNLFPTNTDESPDDHVGADVEYFTEGEDLEAVRDEAVNQIASVCLSRDIPAGQSFGIVLTLSCNDEHVDTDEGSATWDGSEVHIEI